MPKGADEFEALLEPSLDGLALRLDDEQLRQLGRHYNLLRQWNQRINLTALTTPAEIIDRHFGESLFLASRIDDRKLRIVDIGSGGGFPGVPVAVLRPDCDVTLVESVGKKATFLKEVCREIPNVSVRASRLEEHDGTYDWACVRGVAVPSIAVWLRGHVRRLALLTGSSKEKEVRGVQGIRWGESEPVSQGGKRILIIGSIL